MTDFGYAIEVVEPRKLHNRQQKFYLLVEDLIFQQRISRTSKACNSFETMALIPVTPMSSRERASADTPLGHRDNEPKVQVCLDFRQKEMSGRKSKSKRKHNVLEVTIMWVKNLPRVNEKRPNPFVKISLHPGGQIQTTELKAEKSDAQYIEIFEYPIDAATLKGFELSVEVCDRKATRNAKCFGRVCLSLDHIQIGNPICQWFKLTPKD